MRSPVLAACLAGVLLAPVALALDPSKALTQYMLTVWQTDQGLPQNSVFAIHQTRDGYLWMGTEEGLVRFDGVRFTIFDKRNTPAIRHNWIQSLLETSDGSLWIGIVGGGLARYKDGTFSNYSTNDGLPNDFVWDLADGGDGSFWIATDGGLARWANGRITTVDRTHEQLRVLARAHDGTLWIGTDGHGVLQWKNGRLEPFESAALPSGITLAIRETRDGNVWLGTAAGLLRLRGAETQLFTHLDGLPHDNIRSLYEDSHGVLWIGTGDGGVARFVNGSFTTLTTEQGLASNDTRSLFEDREGNLWVGSGGGGVARLRDGTFTMYGAREGLFGDNIRTVLQDRTGAMWIGGRGGVTRISAGERQTFTHLNGLSSDVVYSLHEAHDGSIWVGTDNGVSHCRDGRCELMPMDGLSHGEVRAFEEDADGTLWIGTEGGLDQRGPGATARAFTTKDGLPSNGILTLHRARDGDLWIGTRQGLARITRDGTLERFTTAGLAQAPIISIAEEPDGTLWFGSGAVGLFRLRPDHRNDHIDHFTSHQGLYDDTLMETLEDGAGNFWIGTNRGVFRVSKRELDEVARGLRKTVESTIYGTGDGLRAAECNGGTQPAGWKSADGKLWFATIRGLAMVDPTHLAPSLVPPPVVVEHVGAGNRSWSTPRALDLPAGSNDLEIQYTALSFSAPERVRFRYRLEGFDREWVDAGNRRTAYYTNVPPGTYHFRVSAANESGVWSTADAILPLTIAPRFYETVAFRIALAIVLLLVIWLIDRARIWRMRARERWLTALVAERTRSLEEALAGAEEHRREAERQHIEAERLRIEAEAASRAKSTFLANMSHELRTPMNSIIGFTDILSQRLEDKIDAKFHNFLLLVRTSSQHLLAMINDILDLSKVEMGKMEVFPETFPLHDVVNGVTQVMSAISQRANVTIEVEIASDIPAIETDPGKLKQILFNLLSNAVKFSPRGTMISLAARRIDEKLELSVSDQGPGIAATDVEKAFEEFRQLGPARNAQVGTGLGLSLVRRFSELLGGSVRVESIPGEGSTFYVTLPLRYSAVMASGDIAMPSGSTVLVIDDDDEEWKVVRAALDTTSFVPMRVQSGREALARLQRISPAAAVLDLALRGGEGWEVLAALRKAEIPVIVIASADDSHPAQEQTPDVLIKPVQSRKLIERLQRVAG